MARLQLSSMILFAFASLSLFSGCSKVDLSTTGSQPGQKVGSTGSVEEIEEIETQVPVNTGTVIGGEEIKKAPTTEQQIIRNVIEKNAACTTAGMDLAGRDHRATGNISKVAIKNAGKVSIFGNIGSASVNGAEEVSISGNIGAVCIHAKKIHKLTGNLGSSKAPLVLIGQGDSASVDGIHGNLSSDLMVMNIAVAGKITGNSKNMYIAGGKVGAIHGNGGDLYLLNGAQVQTVTGNYRNIYVSKTARVENFHGNVQIIELDSAH